MVTTTMSCRCFTSYNGIHQCLSHTLYVMPLQTLVSALSYSYTFSHHHHSSAGYTQTLNENIHYGLWEIQCLPVQHLSAAVTTYNNAETVYVSQCWSGAVFPKHFHSQTPFWLQKITINFHILARINIVCPDDRYPKLKICISELILHSHEYIQVAYAATRWMF